MASVTTDVVSSNEAAPSAKGGGRRHPAAQGGGQSDDGTAGWLNWITRPRYGGPPIGFVQATLHRSAAGMTAELAWLVTPSAQGHGFATEAAQQAATSLHSIHMKALNALIRAEHEASAHVARRIGMHSTTISRDGEALWRKRLAAMDKR